MSRFYKVCELVSGNVCTQSASVVAVKVRFRPIEGRSRLKSVMVRRVSPLSFWSYFVEFGRNLLWCWDPACFATL